MGLKRRCVHGAICLAAVTIISGCASRLPVNGYVEKGDVAGLEKYLAKGNSANERDFYGNAAVHLAAQKGNVNIVDTLVKGGVDINARTVHGRTPYMIAILGKHEPLIKYLQEKQIRVESDYKDSNALFDAALTNNLDVMEYVLENGTDVNTSNSRNENALHMASGAGNLESVRFLVAKGIDTSLGTDTKMQPVHYAALSGKFNVVDALLRSRVELSRSDVDADSNNATAILYEYIANREKLSGNNSAARDMYKIASRHYKTASELYLEKAEKVNDEINNKNLKNVGLFILSIAASAAAPGNSVINSSGQVVTVTPVYYPNLHGTGSLDKIEDRYRKLSADMLEARTNCQSALQDL